MPAERSRYRRITRFALRYMLQAWWYEIFLPRIGLGRVAERTRAARLQRISQRFHALAVDLGGLMIKVGQFLSSRLDILPPEVTAELEKLQDEVPAVPFDQIRASAEAELGVTLERAFASVDEIPVAAASLGQVHRARLTAEDAALTGLDAVVLKVQRPGIDRIVDVDLAALRRVADWLSRVRLVSDRVDMPLLVEEFAATSLEEVDYLHEAENAERFAAHMADGARVSAPQVVWERSTRRVLTLQDVTAIKINDVDALRAAGIDPTAVAGEFAAVMFDQLFADGFFHADPHPGNVFVTPHAPDAAGRTWTLTFIDFGMMGQIPTSLRAGLRKLVIAVASRDGAGMVAGFEQVGVLLPSADNGELERALTALFQRFGGMGFAELQNVDPREFRGFADEFGETMRSLPFQLPENFLLIIRAMSLVSGLCSALDPGFNIWESVEPYAQTLLREETGNVVQDVAGRAVDAAGTALRLPGRIDRALTKLEAGLIRVADPGVERRLERLDQTLRRVISAVLFAGLLIGGILLLGPASGFGVALMIVSAAPLLHALLAGSGRRPGARTGRSR
ncbi:AarF/UbiB family protein [Microbacterium sp.]|uniref:ABC1 kinase family protein n=1 Tax=Microbacterium sp. TaxID=51671 RepID=UPI0025E297CD|nr:AarF/UbiB family protein [Microbacterium sp.]